MWAGRPSSVSISTSSNRQTTGDGLPVGVSMWAGRPSSVSISTLAAGDLDLPAARTPRMMSERILSLMLSLISFALTCSSPDAWRRSRCRDLAAQTLLFCAEQLCTCDRSLRLHEFDVVGIVNLREVSKQCMFSCRDSNFRRGARHRWERGCAFPGGGRREGKARVWLR